MKMRCIRNHDWDEELTVGKVYEVLGQCADGSVLIKDNRDREMWFKCNRFVECVPEGTIVSEGTLSDDDLIRKFVAVLEAHDPLNPHISEAYAILNRDSFIDEVMIPELENLAPDGCEFGSHPGDGACFGYFKIDEEEE